MKNYTISEFNPSTIYDVGDRFVYNGEIYEVGNDSFHSDVSPKDEIGCRKVHVIIDEIFEEEREKPINGVDAEKLLMQSIYVKDIQYPFEFWKAVETIRNEVTAMDIIRTKRVDVRSFIIYCKNDGYVQYRTYSDYKKSNDSYYKKAREAISIMNLTKDEFYLLKKVLVDSPNTQNKT